MSERNKYTTDRDTYHVIEKLGRGGQGVTWLVREESTGETRVLKEMRLEQVDDWKALELFEREVEALAALDHPGIPKLLDRVMDDGRTAAIIQTLIEGQSMAEVMARGPLGANEIKTALKECLEILEYLHNRVPPVIHRDINPRNVMMGDRAHLIDFGAVRFGHATNMTSVGTFGYMAPEQIMGRPKTQSDLFSLGMTFLSLVSRREASEFPMDDATGQVAVDKLLAKAGVKGQLGEVLRKLTKPGLHERYNTPKEALQALARKHSPPARQPRTPPAQGVNTHYLANANKTPPNQQGRMIAIMVGATVMLGVVAAGVMVLLAAPGDVQEATSTPVAQESEAAPSPVIPRRTSPDSPGTSVAELVRGEELDVASLDLDDAPSKGPADAAVVMIEFSEFQCPFCARVAPTVNQLLEEYPDDLRVVFKHLPLSFHKQAHLAAQASMAAHQQGKFWEYHDVLFENSRALKEDDLVRYAEELGLGGAKFRADLSLGTYRARVQADADEASALGIKGAPTFLINGRKVSGAMPVETFRGHIDAALADAKATAVADAPAAEEPAPEEPVADDEGTGGLAKSEVVRVMRGAMGRVKMCAKSGDATGTFTVTMVVEPNGTISEASIENKEFAESQVGSCLVGVVKRLKFPSFEGEATTIRYPFIID